MCREYVQPSPPRDGRRARHLHPFRIPMVAGRCPLRSQVKTRLFSGPVELADFLSEILISVFSLLGFLCLWGGLWLCFLVFVSRSSFVPRRKRFEERDSLGLKRDPSPQPRLRPVGGALRGLDHGPGAAERDAHAGLQGWGSHVPAPRGGALGCDLQGWEPPRPGPVPPSSSKPEGAVLSLGPPPAPHPHRPSFSAGTLTKSRARFYLLYKTLCYVTTPASPLGLSTRP